VFSPTHRTKITIKIKTAKFRKLKLDLKSGKNKIRVAKFY